MFPRILRRHGVRARRHVLDSLARLCRRTADGTGRSTDDVRSGGATRVYNGSTEPVETITFHPEEDIGATLEKIATKRRTTPVLIKLHWGLGDAVQLTCVLQHLAKHRPDWAIDVATHVGKHTAFAGQCRRSYVLGRDPIDAAEYDQVFDLGWWECYSVFDDSPCTKVCNCLREVFGITPELPLLKYRIHFSRESRQITGEYLSAITDFPVNRSRYPAVAIHYQGNTSPEKKDLSDELVLELCWELLLNNFTPVILDWDSRSPIPDQQTFFSPGVGPGDLWHGTGTGDAERLAALLSQCALVIGVDSGPLHVAGATDTPTLGVWTGHSPVQFYDVCPNVTHLVPQHWRTIPPSQDPIAARFFEEHYAYRTYDDLQQVLLDTTLEMLDRRGSGHFDSRAPPP